MTVVFVTLAIVVVATAGALIPAWVMLHATGAHAGHGDKPASRPPLAVVRYEHPYPAVAAPPLTRPYSPTATAWTPRELADITMPCIPAELDAQYQQFLARLDGGAA